MMLRIRMEAQMNRRRLLQMTVLSVSLAFGARAGLAKASWGALNVRRNPGCGCCEKWADGLKSVGFDVTMADDADLEAFRTSLGVPADLVGCHTAQIDGYVIEGHVPAADIVKLLLERPDALGLAVPGMPLGSLGMETGGQTESYDVLIFNRDGSRDIFARH